MKMRSLVTGLIVIVLSVTLVGKAIAAGSFSTYNMTILNLVEQTQPVTLQK
jgi:hypothetical protein